MRFDHLISYHNYFFMKKSFSLTIVMYSFANFPRKILHLNCGRFSRKINNNNNNSISVKSKTLLYFSHDLKIFKYVH